MMDMTVAIFHLSSFGIILCHFHWLILCVQEASDKWEIQLLMIAQIDALDYECSRKVRYDVQHPPFIAARLFLTFRCTSSHLNSDCQLAIKVNSPVAMDQFNVCNVKHHLSARFWAHLVCRFDPFAKSRCADVNGVQLISRDSPIRAITVDSNCSLLIAIQQHRFHISNCP